MKRIRLLLSVARIWGFFSMLFLMIFLIGHIFGEDTIYFNTRKEMIAFIFFPIGIVFGLFVAYRSSITGGSIAMLSAIIGNMLLPALIWNFYYLFSIFPGLLFFLHGIFYKKNKM